MLWLAWPVLALVSWVQPACAEGCALAAIILLGVPHGALDGEIARPWMRARFGIGWFAAFAVPYLGLAALVLVAWDVAPRSSLAVFLAGSVWHFGAGQPGKASVLRIVAFGGLPIALPSLFHPAATAAVFQTVARAPIPELSGILRSCALVWLLAAAGWLTQSDPAGRRRRILQAAGLAATFALLPPLVAFALYFVTIHAPAHMRGIARDPVRAPRVDPSNVMLRSLPLTALTLLIGASLLPLYDAGSGSFIDRLLALTIQGLAALTLPHMLLDAVTAAPASRIAWDEADRNLRRCPTA